MIGPCVWPTVTQACQLGMVTLRSNRNVIYDGVGLLIWLVVWGICVAGIRGGITSSNHGR